MKVGDVIRSRYGSLPLWRVDEVYPGGNPYVLARLLVKHNGEQPGIQRLLRREDYQIEEEPKSYARERKLVFHENPKRLKP